MKLISIQVLRAAAALSVVVLHAQYEAGLLAGAPVRMWDAIPWEAGVDVFFVISGFVMVFASRGLFGRPGARARFLARRAARVVPLYWLTTTLYVAVALAGPGLAGAPLSAAGLIASYAFVPVARPDGGVLPVYSLGWTLNYEMFFYVLLAFALGLSRRVAVALVGAALAMLVAVVLVTGAGPPVGFWGDPIVLEFAFGMVLGLARTDGLWLRMAGRAGLAATGLVLFWFGALWWPELHRALRLGGPAALLVAAAGLAPAQPDPSARAEPPAIRLASLLGDASYALYLVHPFAIRGLRGLVQAAGLGTIAPWLFVAAGLAAASFVAMAVHLWIERPLVAGVRAWLEPRTAPA